ncbi:uncharacterized protein SCHCODRAFT_02629048 [Schizophyllum commune H4-8]|uniref:Expressed protein n=1 Tax=Schizophyllum commune (strain H4-8 / FGSC 9210) TaxID=578458 RepID=D8Q7M7_SCHCM|nr:uncharacterized protein SCHCODRAFT_02629048 [Schizophyllum commune H4-8]KAI5891423.1 hypothetical protein SCHCODRAFT_02629048 [Schizophyllum commune H4-8]
MRAPVNPFSPSRPFARLRSFHLHPVDEDVEKAETPSTPPSTPPRTRRAPSLPNFAAALPKLAKPLPLPSISLPQRPGARLVWFMVAASITFILVICVAFVGGDIEQPYLKGVLDNAAKHSPGLVLIGENVDIDVDEPSIGIRWSILACGAAHMQPGSGGLHGSRVCGLPKEAVQIFVDSDVEPTGSYDPKQMPTSSDDGHPLSAQNLFQFDSDHVLDVHDARLYPFDTYYLSGTLRAMSPLTNESIPIRRLATVQNMLGFFVDTTDVASLREPAGTTPEEELTEDQSELDVPSRDFEMRVSRQGDARFYALALFGLGWFAVHVQGLMVYFARKTMDLTVIRVYLAAGVGITIALPQLRNAMPDGPDLDGVLIDAIGYFPQVFLSGLGVAVLLLILIVRQSCAQDESAEPTDEGQVLYINDPPSPPLMRSPPMRVLGRPSTASSHGPARRPPSRIYPPTPSPTTPGEVAEYEKARATKHLRGEYVFPPVQLVGSAMGVHKDAGHRRFKTVHFL